MLSLFYDCSLNANTDTRYILLSIVKSRIFIRGEPKYWVSFRDRKIDKHANMLLLLLTIISSYEIFLQCYILAPKFIMQISLMAVVHPNRRWLEFAFLLFIMFSIFLLLLIYFSIIVILWTLSSILYYYITNYCYFLYNFICDLFMK